MPDTRALPGVIWDEDVGAKVAARAPRLYPGLDASGVWGWTTRPTEADGIIGLGYGGPYTDLLPSIASGRYQCDGVDDYIDLGSIPSLNGANQAVFAFELEADSVAANMALIERGPIGTDGQIYIRIDAGGRVVVFVPTFATDGATFQRSDAAVFAAGTRGRLWVVYDGTLGAASRVKLYWSLFDQGTLKYGTPALVASTATGTIPTTLLTPAATNARVGLRNNNTEPFNGKLDDLRIAVNPGGTIDPTTAAWFDTIVDPKPWLWNFWWPFDGNANSALGALNGTVSGAVQIADWRQEDGRFERFTRQGQYFFDGVDDDVSLGNWAGLDGAAAFSMLGVFTYTGLDGTLFARYGAGVDTRQIVVDISGGRFRIALATDLAGASAQGVTPVLTVGAIYAVWGRFDGSQGTNAGRLRIGLSVFDPVLGKPGTFVEQTLVFTNTIPAALTTPVATNAYFGRRADGVFFRGLIDEWRIHATAAVAVATLNALTVYDTDAAISPNFQFAWHFNGNANSSVGALNGTVTGAIQWYDGRQPEGWTPTGTEQVDRATGSNEAALGTYGIRFKAITPSTAFYFTTAALTAGRGLVVTAKARSTTGAFVMQLGGAAFPVEQEITIPQQATMADLEFEEEVQAAGGAVIRFLALDADTEIYVDHVNAYEYVGTGVLGVDDTETTGGARVMDMGESGNLLALVTTP